MSQVDGSDGSQSPTKRVSTDNHFVALWAIGNSFAEEGFEEYTGFIPSVVESTVNGSARDSREIFSNELGVFNPGSDVVGAPPGNLDRVASGDRNETKACRVFDPKIGDPSDVGELAAPIAVPSKIDSVFAVGSERKDGLGLQS